MYPELFMFLTLQKRLKTLLPALYVFSQESPFNLEFLKLSFKITLFLLRIPYSTSNIKYHICNCIYLFIYQLVMHITIVSTFIYRHLILYTSSPSSPKFWKCFNSFKISYLNTRLLIPKPSLETKFTIYIPTTSNPAGLRITTKTFKHLEQ